MSESSARRADPPEPSPPEPPPFVLFVTFCSNSPEPHPFCPKSFSALAAPSYAKDPVKEVSPTEVSSKQYTDNDRLTFLAELYTLGDPRLDINNIDLNGLEITVASAKKSENGWRVTPTISKNGDIGAKVAFRYTGGGFREFLWGVSRPLHLYNHDEHTGKLEILPFYLDPIEAGGALSPLNPYAWKENASLAAGALGADIAIAGTIYALSQDSSSSSSPKTEYARDSNGDIIYNTNPTTGEPEPVSITIQGDSSGGYCKY